MCYFNNSIKQSLIYTSLISLVMIFLLQSCDFTKKGTTEEAPPRARIDSNNLINCAAGKGINYKNECARNCFDNQEDAISLKGINKYQIIRGMFSSKKEFERKLKAKGNLGANFKVVDLSLSGGFTKKKWFEKYDETLIQIVNIYTVKKNVDYKGMDVNCKGSLLETMTACGCSYVKEVVYGGSIILTGNAKHFKDKITKKSSAGLNAQLEILGGTINVGSSIKDKIKITKKKIHKKLNLEVIGFGHLVNQSKLTCPLKNQNCWAGVKLSSINKLQQRILNNYKQAYNSNSRKMPKSTNAYGKVIGKSYNLGKLSSVEKCANGGLKNPKKCLKLCQKRSKFHHDANRAKSIINSEKQLPPGLYWEDKKDYNEAKNYIQEIEQCESKVEKVWQKCINSQNCNKSCLNKVEGCINKVRNRKIQKISQPLSYDPLMEISGLINGGQKEQSSKKRICFLKKVKGKLNGGGERVQVIPPNSKNGRWTLKVETNRGKKSEALSAEMWCIPKTKFKSYNRWITPQRKEVSGPKGRWGTKNFNMGQNNGFCYLSGIGGKFRGGGERARVQVKNKKVQARKPDEDSPWWVPVENINYNVYSEGIAAGPANLQGRLTKTQSVQATNNEKSEPMPIKRNEGVCFFKEISGGFQGSGEEVSLKIKNGKWYLYAESSDPKKTVKANAQCIKFK